MESREGGPGRLSAGGKDAEGAEGGYAGEIIPEATWVGFRFLGENLGKSFKVFRGDIATGAYFKEESFEEVASRFKVKEEGEGVSIRFAAVGRRDVRFKVDGQFQ